MILTEQARVDFSTYMATEQRALLRLAAALSGDGATADDIVADVLGRAYEQWDRIAGLDRVAAYVRRMVVNEFLTRKRRQKRTVLLPAFQDHHVVGPDHAHGHAEREALKARMAGLPERQRAVLVLRYFEDLPDDEIAEVLDCATGTVRSLASRALATLRVQASDPTTAGDDL